MQNLLFPTLEIDDYQDHLYRFVQRVGFTMNQKDSSYPLTNFYHFCSHTQQLQEEEQQEKEKDKEVFRGHLESFVCSATLLKTHHTLMFGYIASFPVWFIFDKTVFSGLAFCHPV